MTDKEKTEKGREIAELLYLKKNESGRYDTTWGDKTALGLYETIKRIINNQRTIN